MEIKALQYGLRIGLWSEAVLRLLDKQGLDLIGLFRFSLEVSEIKKQEGKLASTRPVAFAPGNYIV